jgi:hypothetical protein
MESKVDRTFRKDVHCSVFGLSYDFDTRTGQLHMGEGHCCDMTGCINLFKKIDKNVKYIFTFAGEVSDTAYCYSFDDDEWSAHPAPAAEDAGAPR